MDARDPILKAIQLWSDEKVDLQRPWPADEVETFFRTKLGFPLSRDVLTLYSLVGGFAAGTYDRGQEWSLWSPERILEENEHNPGPYLWFADYDISLHFYAFEWISTDVSAVRIDDASRHFPRVAGSVAEFFTTYLTDPEALEIVRRPPDPGPPTNWWWRLGSW